MIATSIFLALIMLVPGSVLLATPAPAQASSESESEAPELLVVDGWTHEVPLKAVQDSNGNIEVQDDFEIEADDIITVEQNNQFVAVPSDGKIDSVKVTDTQQKVTQLQFDNIVVKQNLAPKSYILDVIVLADNGDKYAFETVMTVLAPGQTLSDDDREDIIQSFMVITIDIEIVFSESPGENDTDTGEPNREEICRYTPNHPICAPDENGECGEGFNMNEDGQCFPDQPCPSGYTRPNDDETGRCVNIEDENLEQCNDGSWRYPEDSCYGEDPTPPVEDLGDNMTGSDTGSGNDSNMTDDESSEVISDLCLTSFGPPPNCDEVPEEFADDKNGEALDSNCGGVPCTASDKENSTTTDHIPGDSEPEPESENVEVEEEPEESEDEEPEEEGETNSETDGQFD